MIKLSENMTALVIGLQLKDLAEIRNEKISNDSKN